MRSSMLDQIGSSERQMIEAEAALFRHQDRRCNAGHVLDLARGPAERGRPDQRASDIEEVDMRSVAGPEVGEREIELADYVGEGEPERLCSIKFLRGRLDPPARPLTPSTPLEKSDPP